MTAYLDLQAQLGGEYIHPGSRDMTDVLLGRVSLQANDRVLEIGGGTGATAVLLAQRTGARVSLLERSDLMLAAAQARVRAFSLQITLTRADAAESWPVTNDVFEIVYAESVVALLNVPHVLSEAVRVLRPGGRLFMNERIWKSGVTQHEVDRVNAVSHEVFGIPAATNRPWACGDWLDLMRQAGLVDVSAEAVDALLPPKRWRAPFSRRVTRLRRYLSQPALLWQLRQARRQMRQYQTLFINLESFLFTARKPA